MTDLYVVVSAATGDPLWAAVTDRETAESKAVVAAVNGGNCNLLNGRDMTEHLARRDGHPSPEDTAYRPTGSCGCGHEIVWVGGQWEHNVASYIWGDDHDIDTPAPGGLARAYWDREDMVE